MSDNGPRKAAGGFCSLSGVVIPEPVVLAVLSVLCGLIFFGAGSK